MRNILNYSESESLRTGLKVYRGTFYSVNPDSLMENLLKEMADIAIVRIPTGKYGEMQQLDLLGLPYMICDVLVYYRIDLISCNPRKTKNENLEFIQADKDLKNVIDKLIANSFSGYKNHYSSNPIFKFSIVDAYQQWAEEFYSGIDPTRCTWMIKKGKNFIGFATCKTANGECEIVLNGIHFSEAGKGSYTDLIRFLQSYYKSNGYSILRVSTQVDNYAVQKVWQREGLNIENSFYTVHINSLMSYSVIKTIRLKTNKEELEEISIDKILEDYYQTLEFIVRKRTTRWLKQVEIDDHYAIEISFPVFDDENFRYQSVARLIASDKKIYCLSYVDLSRKGSKEEGF